MASRRREAPGVAERDGEVSAYAGFVGARAVVTGGGQGIGAAIATGLADRGAHVVVSGRRKATLDAVRASIIAEGGSAEVCVGDVTDPEHVHQLMALAGGSEGVIDILVNNAGIPGPTAPLVDVTLAEWEETIAVNLTGVFLACKVAVPYLERAAHGKIVNIGSVTGKQPLVNRAPYAAAKLGVVGLTRTLAHELGPSGINVNVISPWLVGGERLDSVIVTMAKERGLSTDGLRAEMTAGTAFKRTVSEADVVEMTLFLSSTAASSITGQDINVSAGAVMY
ncbi:MAG: SDR family NAD(P)-dependent oxidoreductase [Solirubrobacteraceae bacterium]|jgi:NAD(P)-dependent dehydrogenase (short-subunit alcohol dehydrogenase family)